MKKSILTTGLLVLALGASSLSANKFDLRTNMLKLNSELNEIQRGFVVGDKKAILASLDTFAENSQELLGHKEEMMKKLPANMKNKKHKVTVSLDSARKIKHNVKRIKEALANKEGLSDKKSRAKAQSSYLKIVDACFACHNLVRDKKRFSKK